MSFRSRLLIGLLVAAGLPLALFAVGVRREVEARLTEQYESRARSIAAVLSDDLSRSSDDIGRRLEGIAAAIRDDPENRFRRALSGDPAVRRYLLDYAGSAMRFAGLDMLQIQDADGRIISSGHYRNAYDTLEPRLPALLAAAPGGRALVQADTPGRGFIAWARIDSLNVAGRNLKLVGGVDIARWLATHERRSADLVVTLRYPGGPSPMNADSARLTWLTEVVQLPYVEPGAGGGSGLRFARLEIAQSRAQLAALKRRVEIWFAASLAAILVIAVLLASWLAARISRPIRDLGKKAAVLDLDRLDVDFDSSGDDEIGALSRLLSSMTLRLKASISDLREAERRATIGDIARQVNHDIRNGLAPIRNVVRHLNQVRDQDPDQLPRVLAERSGTLASSIEYLESLAGNYGRLTPATQRELCDPNAIVADVVAAARGRGRGRVEAELGGAVPRIVSEPMAIRRILENLIGNALDSLEPSGTVAVRTEWVTALDEGGSEGGSGGGGGGGGGSRVRISVSDTGRGMTDDEMARAFEDFYTTKADGSGLGLSIVRRLVMDLNGSIALQSEPGVGTRAVIEIPIEPPRSEAER